MVDKKRVIGGRRGWGHTALLGTLILSSVKTVFFPILPLTFNSPPKTQLSVDLSGPDGTLTLRARGLDSSADPVSCVFSGEGVEALMDLHWHKVALSVQHGAASLHVDCSSIETKPLEPRGVVDTSGHTLLAVRASDAGPVQVWQSL